MKKQKTMSWHEMLRLNIRAFKLLYQYYPQMILSRFSAITFCSLTPYIGIYLSAQVIDELAGAQNPARLQLLVTITLLSGAVISLLNAFLEKWKNTQNAGQWLKLEHIFSEKFLDMDYINLDETKTAELFSSILQNQNSAGWGFYSLLIDFDKLLTAIFTFAGGISLTVSLFASRVPDDAGAFTILNHPLFSIVVIALMLAVTCLAPLFSTKAGSYSSRHISQHNLANRIWTYFSGIGYNKKLAADVRIYRQDKICDKYMLNKESTFASKGMFAKYCRGPIGLYSAASSAVSVLFTGIVYFFVCIKAWSGAFGLGAITQYIASITKVSDGVSSLIGALGDMRNNAPFLAQIFTFLDIPNDMYQGSLTVEKRNDRNYEIEFRNVSFRYPGSSDEALHNVSLKFKIGSRLAIVGMNGSGKTTFIKLLCRLYDPTEGVILLNGIDIRKYDYTEYMMIFSIVFQDFKLFSLKLGENVATNTAYDKKEILDCLEKSGFTENLAKMKHGTETYLYKDYDKDGINISGGEAQKIAIARALYKDAPFIILDEPTAALDPIAEAEIYEKFNDIAGDKTTVYISHRLSSCKFCDEILVFHNGSVIQQGTHAALVSDEAGKYYELWHAQAQYYTA